MFQQKISKRENEVPTLKPAKIQFYFVFAVSWFLFYLFFTPIFFESHKKTLSITPIYSWISITLITLITLFKNPNHHNKRIALITVIARLWLWCCQLWCNQVKPVRLICLAINMLDTVCSQSININNGIALSECSEEDLYQLDPAHKHRAVQTSQAMCYQKPLSQVVSSERRVGALDGKIQGIQSSSNL